MSSNNELIIAYIKREKVWAVFENCCVDNDFKHPISSKGCMFKDIDYSKVKHYAQSHDDTEYGITTI